MADAGRVRDEVLLVASAGQQLPFVDLYRRIMPGLLACFVRRTLDAQVAADLTAETVAEVYASRGRFRDRGPGSALAWIYAIAAAKLSRYVRRQRVEDAARRRLGMAHLELSNDDIERIEALIDLEQIGRAVKSAFGSLHADQREALRLRVIEGRSYGETAAELGCSEDTARARVSRGLKRLAAQLDG